MPRCHALTGGARLYRQQLANRRHAADVDAAQVRRGGMQHALLGVQAAALVRETRPVELDNQGDAAPVNADGGNAVLAL